MPAMYVDHTFVIEKRGEPPVDTPVGIIKFDYQDDELSPIETLHIGIDNPPVNARSTQEAQLAWAEQVVENYVKPTPLPRVIIDPDEELVAQLDEINLDSPLTLDNINTKLKEFRDVLLGRKAGNTARIRGREKVEQ